MNKFLKILLIVIAALILVGGVSVFSFLKFYTPKLTVDFSKTDNAVTHGASGFLYGFSEPDIPSSELAQSINVSTLSTKALGGLQHPIGDVNQVADTFLESCGKYIIIYTQDMYDTWYYKLDSVKQYHDRVTQTVYETEKTDYADKVVYCIYNEMDNGEWFGDYSVYENRVTFYESWKETYNLVKSINPEAKIGGPGFMKYNGEYIKEFLQYCITNNCLPQLMIWHELGNESLYNWDEHFNNYNDICNELGIIKIPVNITEYGLMKTNGIPGESVKWISRIESTECDACCAYWRLANNLSDVTADDVMPNSNWWAYRWYSEMSGKKAKVTCKDLSQSNLGNYITGKSQELQSKGLSGLATIDEENKKIQILVGGTDRDCVIDLKNLDKTESFNRDNLLITVEYVDYKGLSGAVTDSIKKVNYSKNSSNGHLKIKLDDIRYSQVLLITVEPTNKENLYNKEIELHPSVRYEAEDAKTFGTSKKTDKTNYAASQGKLVKATSKKQSGVEFNVKADSESNISYKFELVYGNGANGVTYDKKSDTYSKGERTNLTAYVQVNENEPFAITLNNTLKDDFTDCVTFYSQLKDGNNKVRVYIEEDKEANNTVSFDFVDVSIQNPGNYVLIPDKDKTTNSSSTFLAIAPSDGYYSFYFNAAHGQITEIKVNSQKLTDTYRNNGNTYYATIYLHRGLSYIETNTKTTNGGFVSDTRHTDKTIRINSTDATLSDNAMLRDDKNASSGSYIDSITSDYPSSANFNVNCEKDGVYQLTFNYANNEEGGAHDYNVDLVERYITLSVNDTPYGNVYFRNTQSNETYKTKTVTVTLKKGTNVISYSNDGSYKFNGKTTYAPNIDYIEVSPIIIND